MLTFLYPLNVKRKALSMPAWPPADISLILCSYSFFAYCGDERKERRQLCENGETEIVALNALSDVSHVFFFLSSLVSLSIVSKKSGVVELELVLVHTICWGGNKNLLYMCFYYSSQIAQDLS